MSRLQRRRAPHTAAARTPAAGAAGTAFARWRDRAHRRRLRPAGLAAGGSLLSGLIAVAVMTLPAMPYPHHPSPAVATPARTAAPAATSFRRIILPDLVVIAPQGLSPAQVTQLGKVPGVRNVLAVDGARITAGGHPVNVLGVDPQLFRSWTPLGTASNSRLWAALADREFLASRDQRRLLHLHRGTSYQLTGARTQDLAFGGSGQFGVAGIDLVVSNSASAGLGLVHNVAAMISAPGAAMGKLKREVGAVVGSGVTLTDVRPQQLPVDQVAAGVRPTTYLDLFKQSAARYCPGMSWTVLAAIGQIESGDGANMGPSSAGALGPMQFMPSTWAAWGITAFGETGPPNVMDPYDAVPSAARYLCAAGAGTPAGLYRAVFAYNHADWYVREVLALAQQYARQYG